MVGKHHWWVGTGEAVVGSTSSVEMVVNHDGGTSLVGEEYIMCGVHHGGWYIIGGSGVHHVWGTFL